MTSLVNGLFIANSIGSLLDSGYTGGLVWDLRNGWTTDGNNSQPALRLARRRRLRNPGRSQHHRPSLHRALYRLSRLLREATGSKIIQAGGKVVSATSNYGELTSTPSRKPTATWTCWSSTPIPPPPDRPIQRDGLSAQRPGPVLAIRRDAGLRPKPISHRRVGSGQFHHHARFTGDSFSYAFPAYSMTVIDLTPMLMVAAAAAANPNPVAGTTTALTALGSENGTGNGLTYTWSATDPSP